MVDPTQSSTVIVLRLATFLSEQERSRLSECLMGVLRHELTDDRVGPALLVKGPLFGDKSGSAWCAEAAIAYLVASRLSDHELETLLKEVYTGAAPVRFLRTLSESMTERVAGWDPDGEFDFI